MTNTEIFEIADRLKAYKDKKSELEDEVKQISAFIDELDKQLSDAMAEAELDKFTRNGHTFYINSRLFASPKAGQKDALFAALRQQGFGDMVKETVNSNTLSSFVKEQIAENNDEVPGWLEPVVNTFNKITVGIRKG